MILTSLKINEIPNIDKLPIVCECLDVFPEDVLELPPQKEIEFTIDLYLIVFCIICRYSLNIEKEIN